MTDQAHELGSDTKGEHASAPEPADHDASVTSTSAAGAVTQEAAAVSSDKKDEAELNENDIGDTGKGAEDDVDAKPDIAVAQEGDEEDDDGEQEEEEEEEDEEEDDDDDDADDDAEEEDDEDDEDEEPSLKISRLTPHLNAVYRNGDATSAFLVAGDKMVSCSGGLRIGTLLMLCRLSAHTTVIL